MGISSSTYTILRYLCWSRSPFGRVFYRSDSRRPGHRPAVSKAAVAAVHKDPRYFESLFEMGEIGIEAGGKAQTESEYIDRSAREAVDAFYLLMRSKKPLPGRVKAAERLLVDIFELNTLAGIEPNVWSNGKWPYPEWFEEQGVDENDV